MARRPSSRGGGRGSLVWRSSSQRRRFSSSSLLSCSVWRSLPPQCCLSPCPSRSEWRTLRRCFGRRERDEQGDGTFRRSLEMDEETIDREAMGRLAKALAFICGADHPTTVALKTAAESGAERDIKTARTLFLRLKQTERRAALAMLED